MVPVSDTSKPVLPRDQLLAQAHGSKECSHFQTAKDTGNSVVCGSTSIATSSMHSSSSDTGGDRRESRKRQRSKLHVSKREILEKKRKKYDEEQHKQFMDQFQNEGFPIKWHPHAGPPVNAVLQLTHDRGLKVLKQSTVPHYLTSLIPKTLALPGITTKCFNLQYYHLVQTGKNTPNFTRTKKYNFMENASEAEQETRCFSIIADTRQKENHSIDIEIRESDGGEELRNQLIYHTAQAYHMTILRSSPPRENLVQKGFVATTTQLVYSQFFQRLIFAAIGVSILTMALSTPLFEVSPILRAQHSTQLLVLGITETLVSILFSLEMLMKVVALEGPLSYLRDPWNCLDGAVVVLGWAADLAGLVSSGGAGGLNFTAFRAFRALRVLRTIKFLTGMRQIVETLFRTLGMVAQGLLVYGYAVFVFAGFGYQVFGDALLYRCASSDGSWAVPGPAGACRPGFSREDCGGELECRRVPPGVSSELNGFHSMPAALLTVYRIATRAGMGEVLRGLMKVKGPGSLAYFLGISFFVSFMVFALFIAIIRQSFAQVQAAGAGGSVKVKPRPIASFSSQITKRYSNAASRHSAGAENVVPGAIPGSVGPIDEGDLYSNSKTGYQPPPNVQGSGLPSSGGGSGLSSNVEGRSSAASSNARREGSGLSSNVEGRSSGLPSSGGGSGLSSNVEGRSSAASPNARREGSTVSSNPSRENSTVPSDAEAGCSEISVGGSGNYDHAKPHVSNVETLTIVGDSQNGSATIKESQPFVQTSSTSTGRSKSKHNSIISEKASIWESEVCDSQTSNLGEGVGSSTELEVCAESEIIKRQSSFFSRPFIKTTGERWIRKKQSNREPVKPFSTRSQNEHRAKGSTLAALDSQGSKKLLWTLTMRKRPIPPSANNKSRIVRFCYDVVCMPAFDWFITTCIVLNVITLAIDHHGQSDMFAKVSHAFEAFFSIVFALEIMFKLIAFRGPRNLFIRHPQAKWNIYDCFIVLAALIDACFEAIPGLSGAVNLSVLRVFRLLRIVRVLRKSPDILQIVMALLRSLPDILNLLAFTLLITVVYAVLGMQLYGAKMVDVELTQRMHNSNMSSELEPWEQELNFISPRLNFDTFPNALTSLFVSMTGGPQWTLYSQAIQTELRSSVPFFFLSFSICTTYITLNFMVVIIMSNFKLSGEEVQRQRQERERVIMNSLHLEQFENLLGGHGQDIQAKLQRSMFSLQAKSQNSTEIVGSKNIIAAEHHPSLVRVKSAGSSQVVATQARVTQETASTISFLRKGFYTLRHAAAFEVLIICCIIGSSIGLAFESPAYLENEQLQQTIDILDIVFLLVFLLEFIVKIIVDGVSHNLTWLRLCAVVRLRLFPASSGEHNSNFNKVVPLQENKKSNKVVAGLECNSFKSSSQGNRSGGSASVPAKGNRIQPHTSSKEPPTFPGYFDDGWNRLDFIVLLFTLFGFFGKAGERSTISRVFRVGRILRPLRMINKNKGMKVIVDALLRAIQPVSYTAILLLWFFFTFSVVGVQFYGGRLYSCNDPYVRSRQECIGEFNPLLAPPLNMSILVKYGGQNGNTSREWSNSDKFHFDNVPASLATLFEIIAIKGWTEKLFAASDVVEVDVQPSRNANGWAIYFLFPFIFFGSFFMMKLFVGVIVTTFRQFSGNALLTPAQLRWIEMKRAMARIRPKHRIARNAFERRVATMVEYRGFSKVFAATMLVHLILVATIPETTVSRELGLREEVALGYIIHWVFTCAYIFEVGSKAFVQGLKRYCMYSIANNVDLASAVLMLFVPIVFGEYRGLIYVKALNFPRLVSLLDGLSGISKLAQVLTLCVLPMVNVTCIFVMLLYVYAVIGMQLFAGVNSGAVVGSIASFYTIPESMLSLYQIVAGENWILVMRDCSVECYSVGNCSSLHAVAAKLYFYSFFLVFFGVFINLYAATIIDAYWTVENSGGKKGGNRASKEKWEIVQEDFDHFRASWEVFDPLNKGRISLRWLIHFLRHLGPPLAPKIDEEKQKYLEVRLEIMDHLTTRGTCADGPSGAVVKDTAAFGFFSTLQVLAVSRLPLEHLDLEERLVQVAKSLIIKEELSAIRIQAAYRGWQFRKLVKFLAAWRQYGELNGFNVNKMEHSEKVQLMEQYITSHEETLARSAPLSLRDAMSTKGQIPVHVVENFIKSQVSTHTIV